MTDSAPLPSAVALVGPTGSGKAALGLEIARRCGHGIIVCDSVKVYRGLDIGSASPSAEARALVPHRMVDVADPRETFSASRYAEGAWAAIEQGHRLIVGGTGFYLRAAGWTMTEEPGDLVDAQARAQRESFDARWADRERDDPGAAHSALSAIDPTTAAAIHPNNLVRLQRALWLCEQSGGPISALREADPPRPRLDLTLIVLDPGPDALRARIEARVDRMLAAGWLGEVEGLARAGYDEGAKAMRSLGYRQLLDVVRGRTTLSHAREDILTATRQYARRQRTYFRHQLPARDVVHITGPKDLPWARVEAILARPPAGPGVSPS